MSDFGDFITTGDHARGCAGREYACTCGYDDAKDAEITRLRAELAALRAPAGGALVEAQERVLASLDGGWFGYDIACARYVARAVLDVIVPMVRAEGWRPIETYDPSKHARRVIIAGRYSDGIPYADEACWHDGVWVRHQVNPPSHWRPFPPPPEAAP